MLLRYGPIYLASISDKDFTRSNHPLHSKKNPHKAIKIVYSNDWIKKINNMLLEGYIEFENEITVSKHCLGAKYPIRIAGINGFLATPRMFEGFNDKRKLGPLMSPEQGNVQYNDDFNWGSVFQWPKGDSAIRACKIAFVDVKEQTIEESGNNIALELPKWRSQLVDNISLMLEKDYRGTRRAHTTKSYGLGEFGLFRKDHETTRRMVPKGLKGHVIEATVGPTLGFDANDLEQVLNDTSNGKVPLLPFYFLLDAEKGKSEDNHRKSILDSATAVEVCFSFLISNLLPYTEHVNKYIASKHNSLRLKRELLKVLKVSIPVKEKEYLLDLDSIRNKVIHAGYIPTGSEANAAYKIAKETLFSLLPKKYEI